MKYLSETLLKNEKIIFWTRPHYIIFAPAVVSFIIAFIILIYGRQFLVHSLIPFTHVSFYTVCVAAAFIYAIVAAITAYITSRTSEYGITDKRILVKTGWIRRNSLEIFLDKIEALHVDQTILGRILDFGTIVIIGTGGTHDPFCNVPRPVQFRRRVQQQAENSEYSQKSNA